MKVGLILECAAGGPDYKVCRRLIGMLDPSIVIDHVTSGNKRNLIVDCGANAALLLNGGCDRVVIVWDLYPAWRRKTLPCRKEDREAILSSLQAASIASSKVHLVCVAEELEAWLIADNRAISKVLSTPTRPVRVQAPDDPERMSKPKQWLDKRFRDNGHSGGYRDYIHAEKIVQELSDLSKIKGCSSFKRFALKVADIKL